MLIWANAEVTTPRWWEWGESKIGAINLTGGTEWAKGDFAVRDRCKEMVLQIIQEYSLHDPAVVGDSYQYLRSFKKNDLLKVGHW